ncbi:hypothetical protein [Janthinobacterium sp. P210006]|uniref:hypothetical protein n=1 Tax=Janthinobacterium sp. P210006 TaxID=3112939 RepID=UPI002E26587F|nr:hypothetical protein [Janthinobacterium sp. P210006]
MSSDSYAWFLIFLRLATTLPGQKEGLLPFSANFGRLPRSNQPALKYGSDKILPCGNWCACLQVPLLSLPNLAFLLHLAMLSWVASLPVPCICRRVPVQSRLMKESNA